MVSCHLKLLQSCMEWTKTFVATATNTVRHVKTEKLQTELQVETVWHGMDSSLGFASLWKMITGQKAVR